ncbi:MAG: hypothetical protein PHU96_04000 [Candidatus Omnitrophica bacterium]|nr:hypothetical protein [Candidatus Omnitrophota bacterium]
MNNLNRLQKIVLGLIITLVWFDILCFVLMFLGNVLKWSFLSETFSTGFFSAFGASLGALVALSILQMSITFNSISFSLEKISRKAENQDLAVIPKKNIKFFRISITAAILGILAIVLFLWLGEVKVNRHKVEVALNDIQSIAKSPLANKAIELINKNATVKELLEVNDAMSHSLIDNKSRISLLIPVNKLDEIVYYEIVPFWSEADGNKPISEANLKFFQPFENEQKKFKELVKNKKPFYSLTRFSLRVLCPIIQKNKIEYILLLDTSRQVSDSYLLKRSQD